MSEPPKYCPVCGTHHHAHQAHTFSGPRAASLKAKRPSPMVACAGKQKFESAADAKRQMRRPGKSAGSLNCYHCDTCGQFHIGNRVGKPRRAAAQARDARKLG